MFHGCFDKVEHQYITPKEKIQVIDFEKVDFSAKVVNIDDYTTVIDVSWLNYNQSNLNLVREITGQKEKIHTATDENVTYVDKDCPYDVDVTYYLEQVHKGKIVGISQPIKVKIPRLTVQHESYFEVDIKEYDWNRYLANISWSILF